VTTSAPATGEAAAGPVKKRRKRRTKAEMEAARAQEAAGGAAGEKKVRKGKGKGKKGSQWRKGRQWPAQTVTILVMKDGVVMASHENLKTKKPKALTVALRKMLWKYTEHVSPTKSSNK